MHDLNSALSDEARRQAAYLAICRYAAIAAADLPVSSTIRPDPAFRLYLQDIAKMNWSGDDVVVRAELESRVSDYLDLFEEEPMGADYYPYDAVLLMLTALPILDGNSVESSFRSLWEYALRFAGHVDWQLRQGRILNDSIDYFEKAENRLWLAHSRLGDSSGEGYRHVMGLNVQLAAQTYKALSCALVSAATADFVLIFENGPAARERLTLDLSYPGLKVGLGDSIYLDKMDEGFQIYFMEPGYLYIWGADKNLVARFLEERCDVKALVDPRSLDGAVFPVQTFIREPIEASAVW